ncbi:MAG TPA: hypothetical protein VK324_17905 [Tepidisphaeraceae bacterium]|nr:hypothetical protein [Tepidisphaeraceae bacterium]
MAAAYQQGAWVALVFDVAVDTGGLYVGKIVISDATLDEGVALRGTGAAQRPTPQGVRVQLLGFAPPSGPGVTLTAPADSGIVAAAGGGRRGVGGRERRGDPVRVSGGGSVE